MGKKNLVKCAVSSVVITPPLGTSMAGYFTNRKVKGIYDDLEAKVLVIEKEDSRIMLISCDLVGVPSEFAFSVREAISGRTGIPVSSIMICATHTHTGPVMAGKLANNNYINSISKKIIKTAVSANKELDDCFIEYGSGKLKGYAFNRRYLMKDGGVVTNPGLNNPDVVKPAAGVDYSLNVIKIIDSSNKVKAVVVNCANHCDVIGGDVVSADWPGYMYEGVRKTLGKNVTVMFLNGSAGDINHFDIPGKRVVQNIAEAKRIGKAYAEKVVDICMNTRPLKIEVVGGIYKTLKVPVRKIKKSDIERAMRIIAEFGKEARGKKSTVLESQDIVRGNKEVMVYFARNLLSVARKYDGAYEALELQAIRLGQMTMVCVGGELFTEIGLAIKRNRFFKPTLVIELANGYGGYLPTKRAFKEGGYETMPTETNKMGENVEGIILKGADKLLEMLRGFREGEKWLLNGV